MLLETGNLYIRSLEPNDAQTFSRMAKDGSLLDLMLIAKSGLISG